MRQISVKNASKMRGTPLGENTLILDDTEFFFSFCFGGRGQEEEEESEAKRKAFFIWKQRRGGFEEGRRVGRTGVGRVYMRGGGRGWLTILFRGRTNNPKDPVVLKILRRSKCTLRSKLSTA